MLLHRQTRGHSLTSTRSWLICSGHHCPEAGGLRARWPLAGTGLRREGLAAQSKVPASEGSGFRAKDGGTETLPSSLTCLLISPLAGYRGDQISKQFRCLHPSPIIANRETALGIVPWDFLFSLMVSVVLDVRFPEVPPWGALWIGHPGASLRESAVSFLLVSVQAGLPAHSSGPCSTECSNGLSALRGHSQSHRPAIPDPPHPSTCHTCPVCSHLHANLEVAVVPFHLQFLLLLAELTPEASANL